MKYFKYEEFFRSYTVEQWNKEHPDDPINNHPQNQMELLQVHDAIKTLVDKVLDPLRERFGNPIYITSGYRCSRLNHMVGGEKRSQHLVAKAADISAMDKRRNILLAALIVNHLDFDQLIFEGQQRDKYIFDWLHVSYSSKMTNRNQILLCKNHQYHRVAMYEVNEWYKKVMEDYLQ